MEYVSSLVGVLVESPEIYPTETYLIISLDTEEEEIGPKRYVLAVNLIV